MPYILGLTGNIASGKTTVGLMLLELGATTYVDADQTVHELYLPGQPLAARLAQEFGTGILNAEGGVDRARLGELVFGDPEQLRRLEAIVHPAVQSALVERLRTLGPDDIGVLDAVKLVEAGYAPFCQGVWVVTCPEAVQLRRLMETRGLSEAQAQARLIAQPEMERKLAVATEVIHNDGSLDVLRAQISAAWLRFRQHIGAAG
jgi:dephospho-CoA kinase